MPTRRADDQRYTLASNASATGTAVPIPGGQYTFAVEGTAGGATLSLQLQAPSGTWADLTWCGVVVKTLTLPFALDGVALPAGNVRLAVAGGTPSGLNATLQGLG